MRIKVISYSMTGNNDALADRIAAELSAEHIRITEKNPRTMGTIAADMIFNRTPQIHQSLDLVKDGDLVVFMGPVWMGHVAAPLRACFKQLKGKPVQYAFCSISGGADGPNPKLAGDLSKRMGEAPVALVDLHIADLLPANPKPTREDTSSYHLKEADVTGLVGRMVEALQGAIAPVQGAA